MIELYSLRCATQDRARAETYLKVRIGVHPIGHRHDADGQIDPLRIGQRQAEEQQERLEVSHTEPASCGVDKLNGMSVCASDM